MRFIPVSLGALLVLGVSWSCGGSAESPACTPGQSTACAGPDACSGFQTCKDDGSGFDPCVCSGASSSSSSGSGGAGTGGAPGGGGPTGGGGGAAGGGGGSGGAGGGGAAGTGGAPSWSPLDLPGLALWLDPDTGKLEDPQKPGFILKWQDRSPNHHVATAAGSMQIDLIALNGHDAIRCEASQGSFSIPDHASLRFGTGDFLIAFVGARVSVSSAYSPLYFWKPIGAAAGLSLAQDGAATLVLGAGGDGVAALINWTGTFHVAVSGRRGPNVFLDLDAASSIAPSSMGDVDNPGDIGLCNAGSLNNTGMEIAEVIAVKGSVGAGDRAHLAQYLHTKFGL